MYGYVDVCMSDVHVCVICVLGEWLCMYVSCVLKYMCMGINIYVCRWVCVYLYM